MSPWKIVGPPTPIIATAIHHGHLLRDEIKKKTALTDVERRREEDPFSRNWTVIAPTQVHVFHSRFEVDLNRPPENCVYQTPEDAWGLDLWKEPLTEGEIQRSRAMHTEFYRRMRKLLNICVGRWGYAIVFDLHTYNHRRDGRDAPPAPQSENPDINIGTGSLERGPWSDLIDRYIRALRGQRVAGAPLDVRENIRFQGGYFPQWIHKNYPDRVCALAIEVKKIFMDEWTGQPDRDAVRDVGQALAAGVSAITQPVVDASHLAVHPELASPITRAVAAHSVNSTTHAL